MTPPTSAVFILQCCYRENLPVCPNLVTMSLRDCIRFGNCVHVRLHADGKPVLFICDKARDAPSYAILDLDPTNARSFALAGLQQSLIRANRPTFCGPP